MLARLLKQVFKVDRSPAGPASPSAPLQDAMRDQWLRRVSTLEEQVRQYCAMDDIDGAMGQIMQRLPHPATAIDAQLVLHRVLMPVLATCVSQANAVAACDVETIVYTHLIKIVEDAEHYEACLALLDEPLYQLGKATASSLGLDPAPALAAPAKRLLFFAHNMGHELAHLTLLCDLIDAFLQAHPEEQANIGLAGASGDVPAPCVQALVRRRKIRFMRLGGGQTSPHQLYVSAVQGLLREGFDRVIFVAAPSGLSFVSGLLDASRLGWLSMKFEVSCIEHLRHRCSFVTGIRSTHITNGRQWRSAAPLFNEPVGIRVSGRSLVALEQARQLGTVFYTINREEKIRNPAFLSAVADILDRVPNSAFVWTGRKRLLDIDAFFRTRGLAHRHFFAGWIFPDDLLDGGDIFLDTHKLSGTVAARAVACGKPVISMVDSLSWINIFNAVRKTEAHDGSDEFLAVVDDMAAKGLAIECSTQEQYVNQAVRLAEDANLREAYGQLLGRFAQRYFFNSQQAAEDHFANLREL